MIMSIIKTVASWFVGGSLEKLLNTIEKGMDDEVRKEEVKAEVTKTWINAQSNLLVGRTWWFQLFFILPMAVHWASINWVSTFPEWGWTVHKLPAPFDEYEGMIIGALFIVDGSKAFVGRVAGVISGLKR